MHTWYPAKVGGGPVAPLRTVADAVATWPEYATAVAVRLDAHDQITVARRTASTICSMGCGGATRPGSARRSPGGDSPATDPPNAGPVSVS
ncbi:nucleotidyltransferase family protein [Micromonospora aurantiaca]|uniref:nucleotidyltransferase family protein n=1 Tax=Micromonospora aurantiaca (nom. illeg.) TaxID=47850 RepID=UPI0033ED024E